MVLTAAAPTHLLKTLKEIYYHQLYWVFENHVVSHLGWKKSPGNEVVYTMLSSLTPK